MADDQEEWSTDANKAIEISIVRVASNSLKTLATFHPRFTYPIFGENESIFGYQGLRINFRFSAHQLRPNIQIIYERKFLPVGETQAEDIVETLKKWAPGIAFERPKAFNAHLQHDEEAKAWKPPGVLLESYSSKGRNFELWCGNLRDPAVRKFIERIQILISFFIEGGTPLELDDQDWTLARWQVYIIFEKLSLSSKLSNSPYSIVGYSTSYRFLTYIPTGSKTAPLSKFTLPPSTPIAPASLPARARISQFLILPSHHSHGHGSRLYNAMVKTFLADPNCIEITVEDPNEAFDDLRDYCDYNRLLQNGILQQITLRTDLDPKLSQNSAGVRVPTSKLLDVEKLEKLRTENKVAPRQFARLVEMHILSNIASHARKAGTARITQRAKSSNPDDKAFYYWRLLVKQRIYKKNKDVLSQLDRSERIDKVEQTVADQASDYERLLKEMAAFEAADDSETSEPTVKRKRRLVVDEDDSDEIMGGDGKRARSESPTHDEDEEDESMGDD